MIGALVAASPAAAQSKFKGTTLLKSDTTMDGARVSYPRTDSAEVTAMLMEVAPGGETGLHMHTAPTFVYVLEGTVEVEERSSGMKHSHGAGEAFLHALNVMHNGRNRGTTPVRIVVVSFGERGRPVMSRAR
jgi:quercetin dioxygenase-like cupin family protein